MKSVQDRIKAVKTARGQVETHCMCLELAENSTHFVVYFPEGYDISGVQCSKDDGKENALIKLLDRIEGYWKQSFITGG